ncbi:MAG: ribosome maturation factor [Thermaurantiacus sp.]
MTTEAELVRLLEPAVEAGGLRLVRVRLMGGNQASVLQVMAEDPATGQMTIDQCAALSRRLSPVLDAADPIPHGYSLEVSSPGIDRPLTRLEDFERYRPHLARLELAEAIDWGGSSRKRFQGALDGIDGEAVCLRLEDGTRACLPFAAVRNAKLLLTDALLKASPTLDPAGADEIEDEMADDAAADMNGTN